MSALYENRALPIWALIPAVLLIAIYAMLSWLAFTQQELFFSSMEMPFPAHLFTIWSWGGKNTAMVTVLVLAVLSRRALPLAIACAMLFVGQMGDVNAGLRTDVNVFITWIAFGVMCLQVAVLIRVLRGWSAAQV